MSDYEDTSGMKIGPDGQTALPLGMSVPSIFPPNANPETYEIESVSRLLKRADYLSIFSIHNPRIPNIPIPSPRNSNQIIGIDANEQLHRFEISVQQPTPQFGLKASNRAGEAIANVRVKFRIIPDQFEATPGKVPPPTEMDPRQSQRFTFLDGEMTFKDRDHSYFKGFGCGRTFPVMVGNQMQLRVGAVVDILEAFGKLKNLSGTVVVNGYLSPPQGLFLSFIVRFVDPAGRLRTTSTLRPLRVIPDPDPNSTFFIFQGEVDPDHLTSLIRAPDGRILGSNVHELLRLVRINFEVGSKGIRTLAKEGPIVGRLSTILSFNPLDPNRVTPIETSNGVFTFFDRAKNTIGTLNADIVEGRAIRTDLSAAPMPVYRVGGFGPFISGTGQFSNVIGMLSVNGTISVFPRTLSNLYVLRIIDFNRKFRASLGNAWL